MRCAEFYEKWKKHPQFCEMSKDSVKLIDAYIDLGDLLVSRGIDEKVVYINFPEGVARSLIQVREAEVRVEALNFVMGYLKKNEKVPAKDLKNLISGLTKKDKVVKSNADAREEIPTIVGTVRPSSEVKKLDPSKTFSPQPGSIQPFTGLRGVHPSTQACQAARCPNIVSRGGGMAKECTLSQKVPGNTPICPLDLQFYYVKYPRTALCREKHCEDLILQRPDLHLCKVTGMRPDNMPGQRCPKDEVEKKVEGEPEPGIHPYIPPALKKPACQDKSTWECCPDLKNHIVVEKIRGRVCEILGLPCNQIPDNICPLERQAKAELGFISAARMIKGEPVKVVPVGVSKDEAEQKLVDVVRGYMTAKDREALGRIMGSGELGDNYVDIFTGLIWWAIERMEAA